MSIIESAKLAIAMVQNCASHNDGSKCGQCDYQHMDTENTPCVNLLFNGTVEVMQRLVAELEFAQMKLLLAQRDMVLASKSLCATCGIEDASGDICRKCRQGIDRTYWVWRGLANESK